MTAPQIPLNETWELAPDGDGESTLWHAGWAVLRRSDMATPRRYQDALWQVLTAVFAPDEATIERLAEVLHHAAQPENEDPGPWTTLPTWIKDILRGQARAVLAALAGTSAQARHTDDDTGGA